MPFDPELFGNDNKSYLLGFDLEALNMPLPESKDAPKEKKSVIPVRGEEDTPETEPDKRENTKETGDAEATEKPAKVERKSEQGEAGEDKDAETEVDMSDMWS